MKSYQILTILLLTSIYTFAQSASEKRFFEKIEKKAKEDFPPPMNFKYLDNSLGNLFMDLYKKQSTECSISARDGIRNYIPSEVLSGYGDELKKTEILTLDFDASNLFFLALDSKSYSSLVEKSINTANLIDINKIIGVNDSFIPAQSAIISPISGFPSRYFHKTCIGYFEGVLDAGTKIIPYSELTSSLKADIDKKSSITTITGVFKSPLKELLDGNDEMSIYTHLKIWEMYSDQYIQSGSEDLYLNGKYVSYLEGTLSNWTNTKAKNLKIEAQLAVNISLGLFNADGNIQSRSERKSFFDIKDFRTSIHLNSNDKSLKMGFEKLPSYNEIYQQLQNSVRLSSIEQNNNLISELSETSFTRNLVGVPSSFCQRNSWIISHTAGYDENVWVSKPTIKMELLEIENEIPECSCTISGMVKPEAINHAISKSGQKVDLTIFLESNKRVGDNKLRLGLREMRTAVKKPSLSQINKNSTFSSVAPVAINNTRFYSIPITLRLNYNGIDLSTPLDIRNIKLINAVQDSTADISLNIKEGSISTDRNIRFDIVSEAQPQSYKENPTVREIYNFLVELEVKLEDGTFTKITSDNINLQHPRLSKVITNISDN